MPNQISIVETPANSDALASRAKSELTPADSRKSRYRTLDHWRGLACLIVVIHHAVLPLSDDFVPSPKLSPAISVALEPLARSAELQKGQRPERRPMLRNWLCHVLHFSVEMFFVISGYCITASAESIRRSGGTIGEYFRRRFIRIVPPFWCALFGSVLACFAIDLVNPGVLKRVPWPLTMPWELSLTQWIGSVTLTGVWIGNVTGEPRNCFPVQIWTLGYEEQFYAIVGILLACSGRRFFLATVLLTAAVAIANILMLTFAYPIKGFFFDEHWFMFAAGIGVYWDLNCATPRQSAVFRTFLVAATIGLVVLASTTSIFGSASGISGWRVVCSLTFALAIIALKGHDETIADWKWLNGLKVCGGMCYSIYLVHLFPGKLLSQQLLFAGFNDDFSILFVCIPLALATSISLAYVFYVLVERRFIPTSRPSLPEQRALRTSESSVASGVTLPFEMALVNPSDAVPPTGHSGRRAA